MTYPVVVHSNADSELEEAAVRYEGRRTGLGLEFIAAVDRVIADIAENPQRFPTWTTQWRRAVLQRFPYVCSLLLLLLLLHAACSVKVVPSQDTWCLAPEIEPSTVEFLQKETGGDVVDRWLVFHFLLSDVGFDQVVMSRPYKHIDKQYEHLRGKGLLKRLDRPPDVVEWWAAKSEMHTYLLGKTPARGEYVGMCH